MILNRLGTKKHIAHLIYPLFPKHSNYVEPFFGAGGMYFQKPRAKYNILNDLDNDVYNLWQIVQERPEALYDAVSQLLVHDSLLQHWRKNPETDPVKKAVRFLLLSNFTFLGAGVTLNLEVSPINAKKYILQKINTASGLLTDCVFTKKDAVKFVQSIHWDRNANFFTYCDPPYLGTVDNYEEHGWNSESLQNLITACKASGHPFAISEYSNPLVLEIAAQNGLHVTAIKERRNLTSDKKATEILLTSYPVGKQKTLWSEHSKT